MKAFLLSCKIEALQKFHIISWGKKASSWIAQTKKDFNNKSNQWK